MARQKMGWSRILCHRYPQIFGRNREKKLRLLFVKFVKQKGPQRFFMDHPWRPLQFSWQRSITGDELAGQVAVKAGKLSSALYKRLDVAW